MGGKFVKLGSVHARPIADPGSDAAGIQRVIDSSLPPALKIDPGTVVTFECPGLPLPVGATVNDLDRIDPRRPHTIVGPVFVRGAHPGQTLVVEILDVELAQGFGHTVIVPGMGLLPDEFPEPYVHTFTWEKGASHTELVPGVRVPIRPFCGFLGNAPAAEGEHDTTPPRLVGGNLDLRHLIAGSRVYLPIDVEGAMFSCGDGHAAQGDGEVCLTAIETAVRATVRIGLDPTRRITSPEFETPGHAHPTGTSATYGTTGIGPDLYICSQDAIRRMIDHLTTRYGLTRQQAYVLCSVAVDLRIGEVVDAPHWLVSAHLPDDLFAARPRF